MRKLINEPIYKHIIIISIPIFVLMCFVIRLIYINWYNIVDELMNPDQESEITVTIATEHIPAEQWWTEEELDMLAAVIYYEAGDIYCVDRHQQLVGQVVINRVNSDEFPDTIYDVITQKNQYASASKVLENMGDRSIIPQRCYDNALAVLNGEVKCPSDIVWQAEFIQGKVYEVYKTPYSTTYFCYR